MKRVKLVAGICLVFLLGVLVGTLGTGLYFKYRIDRFGPGRHPPRVKEHLLKKLTNELDLTKEQAVEIEVIITSTRNKMDEIREKHLPEIKKIADQSFELMKEKLRPEQIEKLDKLLEKFKRNRKKTGGVKPDGK